MAIPACEESPVHVAGAQGPLAASCSASSGSPACPASFLPSFPARPRVPSPLFSPVLLSSSPSTPVLWAVLGSRQPSGSPSWVREIALPLSER